MYDAHEKKALIDSFPGAGDKLGPRLLCTMESHTLQCRNATELASYSGIAPIRQSGKRSRTSKRYRRPKSLHQSFIEWAKCSILYSTWAKAYYQYRKKTLGQTYWSVICSLAFKWIRILYKCWENGIQYDETGLHGNADKTRLTLHSNIMKFVLIFTCRPSCYGKFCKFNRNFEFPQKPSRATVATLQCQ